MWIIELQWMTFFRLSVFYWEFNGQYYWCWHHGFICGCNKWNKNDHIRPCQQSGLGYCTRGLRKHWKQVVLLNWRENDNTRIFLWCYQALYCRFRNVSLNSLSLMCMNWLASLMEDHLLWQAQELEGVVAIVFNVMTVFNSLFSTKAEVDCQWEMEVSHWR